MPHMLKPFFITMIPREHMAALQEGMQALPTRKQKNWHSSTIGYNGVMTRIRFFNGYFQSRVPEGSRDPQFEWPASGWVPVVQVGDEVNDQQIIDTYGNEFVSARESRVDPESRINYEAEMRGDRDASVVEIERRIAENHTGNHHRNKHVKIPTTSGQPVRG